MIYKTIKVRIVSKDGWNILKTFLPCKTKVRCKTQDDLSFY